MIYVSTGFPDLDEYLFSILVLKSEKYLSKLEAAECFSSAILSKNFTDILVVYELRRYVR